MPRFSSLQHWRREFVALGAVLALLAAQAIGLAHSIAHPRAFALPVHAGSVQAAHADSQKAQAFGDHEEGSAECRLLDQLTHADALTAPPAQFVVEPPAAFVAATPDVAVRATCARGYHARGPPRFLA